VANLIFIIIFIEHLIIPIRNEEKMKHFILYGKGQ